MKKGGRTVSPDRDAFKRPTVVRPGNTVLTSFSQLVAASQEHQGGTRSPYLRRTIRIRDKEIVGFGYHTGGYPGRNEIDDTQELDYTKLMRAVANGYKRSVGQEFVPKQPEAIESLAKAFAICDV